MNTKQIYCALGFRICSFDDDSQFRSGMITYFNNNKYSKKEFNGEEIYALTTSEIFNKNFMHGEKIINKKVYHYDLKGESFDMTSDKSKIQNLKEIGKVISDNGQVCILKLNSEILGIDAFKKGFWTTFA